MGVLLTNLLTLMLYRGPDHHGMQGRREGRGGREGGGGRLPEHQRGVHETGSIRHQVDQRVRRSRQPRYGLVPWLATLIYNVKKGLSIYNE